MSICTQRVVSSQPAFSIGAPPGFDVKHVTTGSAPSDIAATDCCVAPPFGQYSRNSRWFDAFAESNVYVTVLLGSASTSAESLLLASVHAKLTIGVPVPPQPPPLVMVFALETSLAKYAAEMSEPRES